MGRLSAVHLSALRATGALLRSVLTLPRVALPVPDYMPLCRRRHSLAVSLPGRDKKRMVAHSSRSTGVKVYGEGEWKVHSKIVEHWDVLQVVPTSSSSSKNPCR
jgi:hypothetical protein